MTTAAAAAYLGVNDSRVRQLVRGGELPAVKVGRDWLIERRDLEAYKANLPQRNSSRRGKRGRPFRS